MHAVVDIKDNLLSKVNALTVLFITAIITKMLGNNAAWIIACLIFLIWSVTAYFRCCRKPNIVVCGFFAVLFACYFFATLFGTFHLHSAVNDALYVCSFAFLSFAFSLAAKGKGMEYISRGLNQINIILILLAAYGILEYALQYNPLRFLFETFSTSYPPSFRSCSLYGNPIPFAVSTLIGICITRSSSMKSFWKGLCYIIYSGALFTTQTRSCWGIFALLLIVFLFKFGLNKRANPIGYVLICFGCLLVLMCGYGVFEDIANRFAMLSGSGSVSHRQGAMFYMLSSMADGGIRSFIFGNGYGSAEFQMSQTVIITEGFNSVDNGIITILFDFGILPIALIAFFLIRSFAFLRSRQMFFQGIGLLYLVLISSGLFYEFLGWQQVSTFFFLCIGLLANSRSIRLTNGASSTSIEKITIHTSCCNMGENKAGALEAV